MLFGSLEEAREVDATVLFQLADLLCDIVQFLQYLGGNRSFLLVLEGGGFLVGGRG